MKLAGPLMTIPAAQLVIEVASEAGGDGDRDQRSGGAERVFVFELHREAGARWEKYLEEPRGPSLRAETASETVTEYAEHCAHHRVVMAITAE